MSGACPEGAEPEGRHGQILLRDPPGLVRRRGLGTSRAPPGKGRPIIAKILEWMPSYAAAHVTGVRAPDGRETEGWFVAAPLLPQQMLELPREEVYNRIVRAIEVGIELGAQVAGLGAFTGVVGDGGVTIAQRVPIPVTTGNSLTIAAGIASLFRGAAEMGVDPAGATAAVIGATGSIGAACVRRSLRACAR